MTVLDQPRTRTAPARRPQDGRGVSAEQPGRRANVSTGERAVSLGAGAILATFGLRRRSLPGAIMASVGAAMIYRGSTGHCAAYAALGLDTAHDGQGSSGEPEEIASRGIHVEQAFLINRSPEDLYTFWRNFANLPGIMTHLERVDVMDNRRSHWVAKAPRIAGGKVEWDAEVTRDEPNNAIAWRSLPGSQVETAGEIRFTPAMGDRGTDVHVFMDYVPPGGRLGHWIATIFGESPRRQMRDDLRNFKRLMECGEIPSIEGQPRAPAPAAESGRTINRDNTIFKVQLS